MISDIQLAIKYRLPKSMRDEFYDHPEYYRYLTYEYWYDLMSKIYVTDKRKISEVHIKNITSAMAASLSESDKSVRITKRKNSKTGLFFSTKSRKGHTKCTIVYSITVRLQEGSND